MSHCTGCVVKTSAFSAAPNIWGVDDGYHLEASDKLIETPWSSGVFKRFVGIDATDDDGVIFNYMNDCEATCCGEGSIYSDIATGELKYAAPTNSGIGRQPPGVCVIDQPILCEFEYPDRIRVNFGGIQNCVPPGHFWHASTQCALDYLLSNVFEFSALSPKPSAACTYISVAATGCGENSALTFLFRIRYIGSPVNLFHFDIEVGLSSGQANGGFFVYRDEFSQCPPPTFLEGIFPSQMPECDYPALSHIVGSGGVVLTSWV